MPAIKEFYLDPRDGVANFEYDDGTTKAVSLDQASGSGGGVVQRPAGTTIVLDGVIDYAPLSIAGTTTLTINGATRGSSAAMVVISNGTNVPAITGADEWASSFGYLNTANVPNRLDTWYDGIARRYAWSQQAVPTAVDISAPTLVSAAVDGSALVLSYSETLQSTPPATSAYSVVGAGGVTQAPASIAITGSSVTLTLTTPAIGGNSVSVSYVVPGSNPIRDASGNLASALSGQVVTNNTGILDAAVTDWLSRVAANGGTVSAPQQSAVNMFVVAAKAQGYWSKISRLNLFAGDQLAAAVVPLVNTSGGSVDTHTGLTYGAANGLTTDGTAGLKTGLIPSGNAGGLMAYLRTTQPSDSTGRVLMGVRDTGITQLFRIISNSDATGAATAGAVSCSWGSVPTSATSPSTTGGMTAGMWHSSRTSATAHSLYKNGVSVGSSSAATTIASPGFDVAVFGSNPAGGSVNANLAAGSSIGAYGSDTGMTSTEAAAYRTHMQAFQTAMGRQV